MDAEIKREPFFTFERIWWAYVIVTMAIGTASLAGKGAEIGRGLYADISNAAPVTRQQVASAEPTPIPIINDDTGETWGMVPPKGARQRRN